MECSEPGRATSGAVHATLQSEGNVDRQRPWAKLCHEKDCGKPEGTAVAHISTILTREMEVYAGSPTF